MTEYLRFLGLKENNYDMEYGSPALTFTTENITLPFRNEPI